jgi:basic membrane protein A
MGKTGVETAAQAHGARVRVLESEGPTTRQENLQTAIDDGADLVIILGFEFNDALTRLAPDAPQVRFLMVDQCLDAAPPNVFCAVFKEFEANFLLGAMAAMLTESGHVGTVGVVDIPFLHRYTDAFAAGARYIDPNVEVSTRWVGGENPFSDPVRAKEQALALAAEGVDYMFAAAAAGNYGIFEAAEQEDFFVFGLDVDQCSEAPGRVVDNILKKVDRVIVKAVDRILAGSAEPVMVFGLGSDGLGLVSLEEPAGSNGDCLILHHPEVIERIRQLENQVVRGEIGIEDPMGLL